MRLALSFDREAPDGYGSRADAWPRAADGAAPARHAVCPAPHRTAPHPLLPPVTRASAVGLGAEIPAIARAQGLPHGRALATVRGGRGWYRSIRP